MEIFRRKKVDFQSKNLVICLMGMISKKENNFETFLSERIDWAFDRLPARRILIRGRNGKFYEPDGSKAYYSSEAGYKRKIKCGDLMVLQCTTPIQYQKIFEFLEEEKRTKTITIERIMALEDQFNNSI